MSLKLRCSVLKTHSLATGTSLEPGRRSWPTVLDGPTAIEYDVQQKPAWQNRR